MALANLASLTLFANRVVAHAANPVVGMVVVPAVGAGDGVGAGGLAVLPGLMVDVVLGALHALLAVVFLCVVASALAAADLAGGVDLVAVFPAPRALDHVDLLRPPVHSALGVEEGDGPFGEFRDSLLLVVGNGERHVGFGLVVVLGRAGSSSPVWAFHEDRVSEEGVCGAKFGLEVALGDRDKVSVGGTGVLVSDSALVCNPSAFGHISDDDPRPLDCLVERCVWVGVAFADDSEDGGSSFFDLRVDRVVCKVDGEVEELGPLGRIGSDVQVGAGTVDFRYDDLDGHGSPLGGLVTLTNPECVSFSVASWATGLLFGGRRHEAVDRDVVVLVFGGGGSGCSLGERLLGGYGPSGILSRSDFCDPWFIDTRGRGGGGCDGGFAFAFGDWGGSGFGVRGGVDEDDARFGSHSGWVDGFLLFAFDLLAFEVHNFPLELAGPSGGDGDLSGWGGDEGLRASFSEVEVGRFFLRRRRVLRGRLS